MEEAQRAAVVDAAPARHSESFAVIMLVAACLCWASFFTLAKNWQDAAYACPGGALVASFTLHAVRTVLALLAYAAIRPRLYLQLGRREMAIGLLLGLINCLGNILQVWGLAWTSPAMSGFFTCLASLWVPILAFFAFRLPVARATWVGIGLGILGLAILGFNRAEAWGLGFGDGLTVLSSFAFALFILSLDRLGRGVNSYHLTLILIAVTGLPTVFLALGVVVWQGQFNAWWTWLMEILRQPAVVRDVLLVTLLSTVLATYLMSAYQPRVSASRAALIYLLEPVFAAILSVIVGHDTVTGRLLLGGALILSGNALVELPLFIRGLRRKRPDNGALQASAPTPARTA